MKELVSLHNITKDTDIEALLDVLMEEQEQFLAANAEAMSKYRPEGHDHVTERVGSQSTAEGETR